MSAIHLKEFKPAIAFLLKFVGLYLVGNLLYGWYVTSWYPKPDPVTNFVTVQSANILSWFGWDATTSIQLTRPTTHILNNHLPVVAVYEGCNGLNVMIVFLSFLFAFGPLTKTLLWFVPLGLGLIHVSNLARITLLFVVSIYMPHYSYFTHKYLFTAFIYLFVFLLWVWWVYRITGKSKDGQGA